MKNDYLGAGVGAFFIHKIAEGESGYNYYGYMHISGQSLIMRQNISTSEVLYSDGGLRLASWSTRAALTYSDILAVENSD